MGIVERLIIAKHSFKRSMQRNKKGWIIRTAIVVAIALLLCSVAVYFLFFAPHKTAIFGPKLCNYVFGCDPSDFSTTTLDVPDEISSLQKNAHVNEDGNLVVKMTYWQWNRFKDSRWVNVFPELEDWPCVHFSEDYSSITITVTPEMKTWDITKVKDLEYAVNTMFYRINLVDMIKNTDNKDRSERIVIYKEIDQVTGETIVEGEIIIGRNRTGFVTYSDGWE